MTDAKKDWVFWVPRVASGLMVAFLLLMSMDSFGSDGTTGEVLLGFFMHNIPTLVFLAVLIVSWKHDIVGGVAYLLGGMLYVILILLGSFEWYKIAWMVQISGPAFAISALFFLRWHRLRSTSD